MSAQADWVGAPPPIAVEFRDIRNTRPTIAEEKAVLAKELGELARKAPPNCMQWSAQKTHEFKFAIENAKKVAAGRRSTVPDLTSALSKLRGFWSAI